MIEGAPFPAPAIGGTRPVLVTGGAGFIGANLVDRLCREGEHVLVFDALTRTGVADNLAELQRVHGRQVSIAIADVRDRAALAEAARDACAVFHFAAQVAVTSSLVDPIEDFEVNAGGTLALLEAVRHRADPPPVIFASTNKVYGSLSDVAVERGPDGYRPTDERLAQHGIGTDRPIAFHTPYGCSKGAADQYVLDYAQSFGLKTAVLRMSCIYGPRQCGTEDQGWVAHFAMRALEGEPVTIFGDGHQVRDVLHVADAVETYLAARRRIDTISGQAFNLGGGPANAVSLRRVLGVLEELTGRSIAVTFDDWRPGDQRWFVTDRRRISSALAMPEPMDWHTGLADLVAWLKQKHGHAAPSAPRLAVAGLR